MADEKVTRKLVAILATDMVGFSRLMEKDEASTVARQKAHRKQLIDPKIAEHNGRIVKSTGDGLLVEFASAVDAVQCAVEVQRAISKLEADIAEDRRIAYRVGVNVGDIIVEDDDIFGDGVNIAARLQILAEPGGICISRPVFTQIRNKVELGLVDLGPQKVKNIAEPVPTYRILLDPKDAGKLIQAKRKAPPLQPWMIGAAVAVLLLVVAGAVWWRPWAPAVEPARLEKMAFPLPKEPSIAVLPFANLTGDKAQDYLAYGIAGKITAKLAKVSNIFVITRPAASGYYRRNKKTIKAGRVAEDFGVRHVLIGSVQRSGDKLRVTVQLVDAVSGRQMWADQYDGTTADIFALQDRIARTVLDELEVKIVVGEQARIWHQQTKNQTAYNLFMRGLYYYHRRTRLDNAQAQKIFKQVVRMDPGFAEAKCLLGFTHLLNVRFRWSKDPSADLARAQELAQQAIAKDPEYPHAYALLAAVLLRKGHHEEALAQAKKALELEPHYANNIGLLALIQMNAGLPSESIGTIRRAMRLYPYYPHWYLWVIADSYRQLGKYDEAILAAKKWRERWPRSWLPSALLAATYVQAGRIDEARKTAKQLLERRPKMTAKLGARILGAFYKNRQDAVSMREALLKAGLP